MPEFLRLHTPDEALELVLPHIQTNDQVEWVGTDLALGRVTAVPVTSRIPLPEFPRSTVDGYAVQAADTYGSSESLPVYLTMVGEVPMGAGAEWEILPASCALIHTGGMLPKNADAVVMLENTQVAKPGVIEILKAVAQGENIIRVGEDVEAGQVVIGDRTRLRPAEIGGLAALGSDKVAVVPKPRVAIISTGDEVVPIESETLPGQVHDVNSYALAALIEQYDGIPVRYGILPDNFEALEKVAQKALSECDMVVITAGSSASTRDLTAQVIGKLGKPGVLVHGINVRPGKPTILGLCNGKVVIGLPGNPVSALVIAGLFIAPILEKWFGLEQRTHKTSVQARLTINLPSQAGREDWVPVKIISGPDGFQADPIFGKSNLIFTLVRADGLVRIARDASGLHAGDLVEVVLSE
jgi:molybdopterin molybdotransferase